MMSQKVADLRVGRDSVGDQKGAERPRASSHNFQLEGRLPEGKDSIGLGLAHTLTPSTEQHPVTLCLMSSSCPKCCWCFCPVTLEVNKTYSASFLVTCVQTHYRKTPCLSHKVKLIAFVTAISHKSDV